MNYPKQLPHTTAIVGNIIDHHLWGEAHEIRRGTKLFSPGTKVYCAFVYGGMGHEHVRVLGKARRSKRMIDVVIRTNAVKNFRTREVYSKKVIAFLNKYPSPISHDGVKAEFLEHLNSNNIEIERPAK